MVPKSWESSFLPLAGGIGSEIISLCKQPYHGASEVYSSSNIAGFPGKQWEETPTLLDTGSWVLRHLCQCLHWACAQLPSHYRTNKDEKLKATVLPQVCYWTESGCAGGLENIPSFEGNSMVILHPSQQGALSYVSTVKKNRDGTASFCCNCPSLGEVLFVVDDDFRLALVCFKLLT